MTTNAESLSGIATSEIHLTERPTGNLTPEHFRIANRQLPPLREGQFLIKNRYLSVDPAMRPPMSNGLTPVNAPISSLAVGEIITSRHAGFAPGCFVVHRQGLRDFAVSDGDNVTVIEVRDEPLHYHLGPLGFAGFTGYVGLFEIARLKPGETIFVSAGAGAVGSLTVQMARCAAARVVASAGSAPKCAWLRDVAGCDAAINYTAAPLRQSLKDAAPEGLDVYFDNVGGDHLDAALPRMRLHGRIAISGMISAYNNKGALSTGVTTLSNMMYKRLEMRAFIWQDHLEVWPQFTTAMRAWLASGAVVAETTILTGLEAVPDALIGLFEGGNLGKMMVALD